MNLPKSESFSEENRGDSPYTASTRGEAVGIEILNDFQPKGDKII